MAAACAVLTHVKLKIKKIENKKNHKFISRL